MATENAIVPVHFQRHSDFKHALDAAKNAYFQQKGITPYATTTMYSKVVFFNISWIASWIVLNFVATSPSAVALTYVWLALSIVGKGFNVLHDGGHSAFAPKKQNWINEITSADADTIGLSSWAWWWKHRILHHQLTNIPGASGDPDVGLEPIGLLAPTSKPHWWYRLQWLYLPIAYLLLVWKMHWWDDMVSIIKGKVRGRTVPRPAGWKLTLFWGGKGFFITWAFIIPLIIQLHRGTSFTRAVGLILISYAIIAAIVGFTLAMIFQLAHCVREAEHPLPTSGDSIEMPTDAITHQFATSVGFCHYRPLRHHFGRYLSRMFRFTPGMHRFTLATMIGGNIKNWLMTQYMGGLNFQDWHHAFPDVAHDRLPGLARAMRRVLRRYGVQNRVMHSFTWAVISHFLFLWDMSKQSQRVPVEDMM